jgi:hypothetical protein
MIHSNKRPRIYKPTILERIIYKSIINRKTNTIKKIRNFGTLNKFRNGDKITKIKPAKLLIKNRGYREILFQKLFIIQIKDVKDFIKIIYNC